MQNTIKYTFEKLFEINFAISMRANFKSTATQRGLRKEVLKILVAVEPFGGQGVSGWSGIPLFCFQISSQTNKIKM